MLRRVSVQPLPRSPTRPAANASKEPIKRDPRSSAGRLGTTLGGTQQLGHNEDKRRNMSTESLDQSQRLPTCESTTSVDSRSDAAYGSEPLANAIGIRIVAAGEGSPASFT
jgi:hypothetical protein